MWQGSQKQRSCNNCEQHGNEPTWSWESSDADIRSPQRTRVGRHPKPFGGTRRYPGADGQDLAYVDRWRACQTHSAVLPDVGE